jgi:hypothetical protein
MLSSNPFEMLEFISKNKGKTEADVNLSKFLPTAKATVKDSSLFPFIFICYSMSAIAKVIFSMCIL